MSAYESLEMAERLEMDIIEKDELITKQAERILNLRLKVEAAKERANRAANDERKKYLPIVTKQAEQIKLLREKLRMIERIALSAPVDRLILKEAKEALAATENKNENT